MNDLPNSWAISTIGNITFDCAQKAPAADEEFHYIDISSIDRTTKTINSSQALSGANAPSRARKLVTTGDVLVSMTRPNLNAVALVPENLNNQIASTGFEVLRPNGVDPRWLFYLVRTQNFVDRMSQLVQGALYPAVRSKDVRGYEVPIASLNEQKRIADKLDAILARVDACRQRLDRIPAILKRFRQAVLAAATSGKLTEDWRENRKDAPWVASGISVYGDEILESVANSWKWMPFAEISEIKSNLVDPKNMPEVVHLAPNHVESGTGRILEISTVRKDRVISNKHQFYKGQIVYSKIRPYLNKVVLVDFDGVCSADMYPISTVIEARYLLIWMLSARFVEWASQKQGRVVLPKINQGALNKIPVPVPPKEEQTEIIRRVEALFAYADRLEARYAAARAQVEKFTPALLAKAFRGELVPQDPSDEPASVLLERIRLGRAENAAKSQRARRKAHVKDAVFAPDPPSGRVGVPEESL